MLITIQPWLRGDEPKVRTVDSNFITSIERQGSHVEITLTNSQIFLEHYPNDEEAARRYDELILAWAKSQSESVMLSELTSSVDTNQWIKLGAYYFKSSDIKCIKQFPSGIRIFTHDGEMTDIIEITEEQLATALLHI